MPELFYIAIDDPTGEYDCDYPGLTLEQAAARMDDLTDVGEDTILSDFDEDCSVCDGAGKQPNNIFHDCTACFGTGKRRDPWEWEDDETGRTVVLKRQAMGNRLEEEDAGVPQPPGRADASAVADALMHSVEQQLPGEFTGEEVD